MNFSSFFQLPVDKLSFGGRERPAVGFLIRPWPHQRTAYVLTYDAVRKDAGEKCLYHAYHKQYLRFALAAEE